MLLSTRTCSSGSWTNTSSSTLVLHLLSACYPSTHNLTVDFDVSAHVEVLELDVSTGKRLPSAKAAHATHHRPSLHADKAEHRSSGAPLAEAQPRTSVASSAAREDQVAASSHHTEEAKGRARARPRHRKHSAQHHADDAAAPQDTATGEPASSTRVSKELRHESMEAAAVAGEHQASKRSRGSVWVNPNLLKKA